MMHGKAIWKPVIGEIARSHKGGLQHLKRTPSCKGQHADKHWVMAYSHKTQFFMKNGGQQKCLGKALITYHYVHCVHM